MCGIFGMMTTDQKSIDGAAVLRATSKLAHRGPDDEGYLLVNTLKGQARQFRGPDTVGQKHMPPIENGLNMRADLALGFRRLSILDLTTAGHQPMSDKEGKTWITYNGEIYNYQEIKNELVAKGHEFKSETDSEVVLHAYMEWGVSCVDRFNGMWAFAIWDFREKRLFLSRDRFGIKPLFYLVDARGIMWGSEIKALVVAREQGPNANHKSVFSFLSKGLLGQSDETFYEGIKELRGGHNLVFTQSQSHPKIFQYYRLPERPEPQLEAEDPTQLFSDLFENSVQCRLVASDVPVGSCLSGGLDSSSIVCVSDRLRRQKNISVMGMSNSQKTFSARSNDAQVDEGVFMKAVSSETQIEAFNVYPSPEGFLEDISKVVVSQEEPFRSTSVYAQWKVFQMMNKQGVKVCLDGQGADEILGGYIPYFSPLLLSHLMSLKLLDFAGDFSAHWRFHGTQAFGNVLRMVMYLQNNVSMNIIRVLRARIKRQHLWLATASDSRIEGQKLIEPESFAREGDLLDKVLRKDLTVSSLPSLLRFEDRNSMAHGVEARLPFLDYRLVEMVFSLGTHWKIHRGWTKNILRKAMKGTVPERIRLRRDKMGFATAEDSWMRGPLKTFVWDILRSKSFRERPYFKARGAEKTFNEFLRGRNVSSGVIWSMVSTELWLRGCIDRP